MKFFGGNEVHLFKAVAKEIIDKTHILVDIYFIRKPSVVSSSDVEILYGETPSGRFDYTLVPNVRAVMTSDIGEDDYVESEQGSAVSAEVEFWFLLDELMEKFPDFTLDYPMIGCIIRYGNFYYEVTDEDYPSPRFEDYGNVYLVRVSAIRTTKLPSGFKVSG